jgi:hypothetical protein
MLQKHLLYLLFFVGSTATIKAQQITEDQQKARLVSLQNDTSFIRFSSKVNALIKTSKGKQTNFAAVKKLFTANKSLLQQLKLKHPITPIQQENENPVQGPGVKPDIKLVEKEKIYAIAPVQVVKYYPPYTEKEIHDYINPGTGGTTETGNYSSTGQIAITTSVQPGVTHWYDAYVFAFRQSVTVPNNPAIVKAHVKFYYHYFNTGWDTETGHLSTDLVINTSPNFVSPAYNQLAARNTPPPMASWKEIKRMASESFNSLRDYSESVYDSYVIGGNVTPGSTIDFKFGMSFTPYNNRVGDFGAYHYRNYRLIMIEVSYYKAQ